MCISTVTDRVRLQVEANLRSRCSEAEAEARGAAERERLAQERMKQHADGTEALQVTNDLHRLKTYALPRSPTSSPHGPILSSTLTFPP